jgi:hypothetical protein
VTGNPRHSERIENPFPLSSDQQRRATLVVASASTDATDCALLLAALGLNPAPRPTVDDHPS